MRNTEEGKGRRREGGRVKNRREEEDKMAGKGIREEKEKEARAEETIKGRAKEQGEGRKDGRLLQK